ncbi:PfkB family carbohydrate kinase [Cryobacterium sp. N19]|uniref:PfkB family carbohydrate kinase n=1 Tax=Cryobacterium sp. N19 TaxID=2048288 RepID=UPI000CE47C31|nr:PfkB family carbohydrate kinase [Cryobacterium sp. N19]
MPKFDVVCIGAANLDVIAAVDTAVGIDQRVTSKSMVMAGGGPAATAAVALARLGAMVAFCGVVGADSAGAQVREMLEREGVDTTHLRSDPSVASVQSIVVAHRDTSTRSIITGEALPARIGDIPVDAAPWLHVDQTGFEVTRAAMRAAGSTARLSVDAGNPIPTLNLVGVALYAPTVTALLERYPASSVEAALFAAIIEGASMVVATDGPRGTWALTAGGDPIHVPGFQVEVESTIGAGDVFHGALLSGLISGMKLERATRRANAVAAISCGGLDGRSAIPTHKESEAFLALHESHGKQVTK